MKAKYPPGPPMTLGNMREQGVHHLITKVKPVSLLIEAEPPRNTVQRFTRHT
jgi:hypothetical protein